MVEKLNGTLKKVRESFSSINEIEELELEGVITSSNNKIVVSGGPGTGKSYHTRKLILHAERVGMNVIVVAPTGAAAAEYKEGQTIHSYVGMNGTNSLNWVIKNEGKGLLYEETLKGPTLMIVDEASFLDAEVIDLLFNLADDLEFRICLVMDPAQLLGVKCKPFFVSKRLKEAEVIRLTKIVRQKDEEFGKVIQAQREGSENAFNLLINYCLANDVLITEPVQEAGRVDICGSRKTLTKRNYIGLLEHINNRGDLDLYEYRGLGESLHLAIDCPVIIRKNDKDKKVVNGDLGIIKSLSLEEVKVYVNRLEREVTYKIQIKDTSSGESRDYKSGDEDLKEGEEFIELPIQLAFALTIHLSQGKTFKKVQLFLEGNMRTMHGGALVGVTRHTDNLKVVCPVKEEEGILDLDFFDRCFFYEKEAQELI